MSQDTPPKFRIVAISGSVRPGNFTGKALAVVCDELRKHDHIELIIIDPAEWQLSPGGASGDEEAETKLKAIVKDATGIVLATPEYHGSYSAVMKIIIESLGFPSVMEGKPLVLIGVAAGAIGAIKATEHLRSVCSHIGALVLPGPVSLASVFKLFDEDGNCIDEQSDKRLRGAATRLLDYIANHICPSISLEEMVREQQAPGNE